MNDTTSLPERVAQLLPDNLKTAAAQQLSQINDEPRGALASVPELFIRNEESLHYPGEVSVGELYLSGEAVVNPVLVTPIYFYKSRRMPRGSNRQEMECVSHDGVRGCTYGECGRSGRASQCQFARWRGSDPPKCMEALNALVLLGDDHTLSRVRFEGESLASGKTLMYLARAVGNIWDTRHVLRAVSTRGKADRRFVWECSAGGVAVPPMIKELAEHLCHSIGAARADLSAKSK